MAHYKEPVGISTNVHRKRWEVVGMRKMGAEHYADGRILLNM